MYWTHAQLWYSKKKQPLTRNVAEDIRTNEAEQDDSNGKCVVSQQFSFASLQIRTGKKEEDDWMNLKLNAIGFS